jgi:hypothetical protein
VDILMPDSLTDRLHAAVQDVMCVRWQWGAADCCTAASDVHLRVFGVDPMAPMRGRYASRGGALRLIRAAGGLESLVDGVVARAGLQRVVVDMPGALGVAAMPVGEALLICLRPGVWAGKTPGGYATLEKVGAKWSLS